VAEIIKEVWQLSDSALETAYSSHRFESTTFPFHGKLSWFVE
jgi:hypothetical protein